MWQQWEHAEFQGWLRTGPVTGLAHSNRGVSIAGGEGRGQERSEKRASQPISEINAEQTNEEKVLLVHTIPPRPACLLSEAGNEAFSLSSDPFH